MGSCPVVAYCNLPELAVMSVMFVSKSAMRGAGMGKILFGVLVCLHLIRGRWVYAGQHNLDILPLSLPDPKDQEGSLKRGEW